MSIDRIYKYMGSYLSILYISPYIELWYNMTIMEETHDSERPQWADPQKEGVTMTEEQKKSTYTPAQKKAIQTYLKNQDEIKIRMPKGNKERIAAAAAAAGESVNAYIMNAISARMESGE